MNISNKNLICWRIIIFLLLALYMGLCFEAAALEVMVAGESHELDGGYSIELAKAEGDEALFVLYKEGGWVDEADVSSGDLFSLDDGEIFHFEAMLDSIFRSEDTDMVELTDYYWEWREEPEPEPTPWDEPTSTPTPWEVTILYQILILSAITIVLIFGIFIGIHLKKRRDRQKIEGYKEKMHEWEKEGYDVSELKEVLGDEKRF